MSSSPTHLVLLVHADPSVRARYVAACSDVGITADVVALVGDPIHGRPGGGLSARYDQLGAASRTLGKGSAIRGLCQRYRPPRELSSYEHVVLACYSAGYGFARQLTPLDLDMLSGLVLVDSGHGPEGLRGDSIGWLVRWGHAARAGRKVLAIGHTDVEPYTYASTTEVAQAAIDRSGGPLADLGVSPEERAGGLVTRRREGGMVVEAYNRRSPAQAKQEHGEALTVWGPALVAQACAIALGTSLTDLGPTTNNLTELGSAPRTYPHGNRCSVQELVRDARELGTWHPAGDGYVPQVGDLLCSARWVTIGGKLVLSDPTAGGNGHVEAVTATEGGDPTTIGGNEANRYVVDVFRMADPLYRGCIERGELGRRAVAVALLEYSRGIKEKLGPQHEEQIQRYHGGTRRGGGPLAGMPGHETEGLPALGNAAPDEIAWCASSQSWALCEAARAG